jgi:asparagine synthase (glutamine-hydrolysing)
VNGFLFASEIKALLVWPEVEPEIDLQALDQIFTFWVPLPPKTIFKNIFQLPPGCSLTSTDGRVQVRQHWSLSYASAPRQEHSEPALAEELFCLLEDATRIRLRSDVPVGTYLSGGIDSTIVTALAQKMASERLHTFSISFEDETFDETTYQQEASRFLSTQHSNVHCSNYDIASIFPRVIWHTEQPILRTAPAPMYFLSELVQRKGFKVVLTGEGADEVLGGYDIFKEAKIRHFIGKNPESQRRP